MITEHTLAIGSVPYADGDPSGFTHHTRLIEYCERARIALFAANGMAITKVLAWGYHIATGKVVASYHRPVRPDDDVAIFSEVKHINMVKIVTRHEVRVATQAAATVECTTVFLDEFLKAKPLPEAAWNGDWDNAAIENVNAQTPPGG